MNMSINLYNNMKRLAAVLMVSAGVFMSCVQIDDQQGGEVGYLTAPELDIDITVDDLTQTKALDFEIETPDVSEIAFVVKDKGGNVIYDGLGLWSEPLTLPVGTYSIEAAAGTNTFGAPYFTGVASGNITPLDREVPSLELSLANAIVKVTVDASLDPHFTPGAEVVFNSGAFVAGYGEWTYVPAGSDLTLSISGESSTGKTATFTHTLTAPSPKVAYNVSCGKDATNWPAISLSLNTDEAWASRVYITAPATFSGNISAENQAAVVYEAIPSSSSDWSSAVVAVAENGVYAVKGLTAGTEYQVRARVGALTSNVVKVTPKVDGLSATASHTTNSAGELDGTDVASTFTKPTVVKNAITGWTLNLCKTDGTVLRSGLSLGNSDGSALTATDAWPYLPKGDYKLVANATMNDGEVVSTEIPFNTSDPSFTVTATCKTTYDYYLANDLNNANAVSGSVTAGVSSPSQSLFDIGSSVSISSALMQNTNYAKSVRYAALKDGAVVIEGTFDFGTSNTNTFGNLDGTFTDWRSYVMSAEVTFAGTKVTGTDDFHITGLPYSYNFVDGSLDKYREDGWTTNGTLQVSNIALLGRANTLVLQHQSAFGIGKQNGYVVSPKFHIPDQMYIEPSVVRSTYTSSGNKERTGYIGAVSNTTSSNTSSISYTTKGGSSPSGTIYGSNEWLNKFAISSSTPYVSVDSDDWSDGGVDAVYYFLHEVHLRYIN